MTDRLLTYPELAEALGRSEEAARQLAKRRRWRRVISNEDGRARVAVPQDFLDAPRPPVEPRSTDQSNSERPEDDHPVRPDADARALLAMLEARVAEMGADLREARADLKQAHATITDLTEKAARVVGLEGVLAAERERIADLKVERDRILKQLEEAIASQSQRRGLFGWMRGRRTA